MAVTMAQVRAVLDPDETNYERARELGPEALPHLEILIKTGPPMLASKAAYLAGLLAAPGSARVVAQAAASDEPAVRVAAAAAAKHLDDADIDEVITPLLTDSDAGVRRMAKKSKTKSAGEDSPASGSGEMPGQVSESGEMPSTSNQGEKPGSSNEGEMPAFPSGGSSGSGEMPGFSNSGGAGDMPGPRYTPGEMPQ